MTVHPATRLVAGLLHPLAVSYERGARLSGALAARQAAAVGEGLRALDKLFAFGSRTVARLARA